MVEFPEESSVAAKMSIRVEVQSRRMGWVGEQRVRQALVSPYPIRRDCLLAAATDFARVSKLREFSAISAA
jgi:hypothetical protein